MHYSHNSNSWILFPSNNSLLLNSSCPFKLICLRFWCHNYALKIFSFSAIIVVPMVVCPSSTYNLFFMIPLIRVITPLMTLMVSFLDFITHPCSSKAPINIRIPLGLRTYNTYCSSLMHPLNIFSLTKPISWMLHDLLFLIAPSHQLAENFETNPYFGTYGKSS